ncbi:MAG: Peptidase C14, caspase catalytic subunit p20 [uncultured bacterium]|nr:MAG: Peptidase C14, caspase catalytic subunit p20 [uncultured bacterium]
MDSKGLIKFSENALDIMGRTTLGRFGIKSGKTEMRHRILPAPKSDPSFYAESENHEMPCGPFSLEDTMVTLENDAETENHYVKIWDMSRCRPVKLVKAHEKAIFNIIKSNDMKYFATCSLDRSARIFDIQTGALIRKFEYELAIRRVTMSDDSRLIIVSDIFGNLLINDVATGERVKTIESVAIPHFVTISKDNRFILVTSEDKGYAYDFPTSKLIKTFDLVSPSSSTRIKTSNSHIIARGGRHYYIECVENIAYVKDLFDDSCVARFDHKFPITHTYVNSKNYLMTLTSENYQTSVWDLRDFSMVSSISHGDYLSLYITSHEKFLIAINEKTGPDHIVKLFDTSSGESLADIYCVFENGYKFCVTTAPDEVSKSGWISTNIAEMIEVSVVDEDGNTVEVLENDDPRRLEYIRSVNRGDIVAARLNDRNKYKEIIGEIQYGALAGKINERRKVSGYLEAGMKPAIKNT